MGTKEALLIVAVSSVAGYVWYKIAEVLFTPYVERGMYRRMIPVREYCKERKVPLALSLIGRAKRDLEIFDRGTFFAGSLYNDESFTQAVINKIRKNPNFTIRCFFDSGDERLAFIRRLKNHPQVEIFIRRDKAVQSAKRYSYMIIDGGSEAHIRDEEVDPREACSMFSYRSDDTHGRLKGWLARKTLFDLLRQPMKEFSRLERGVY